jgi:hypothetical protein
MKGLDCSMPMKSNNKKPKNLHKIVIKAQLKSSSYILNKKSLKEKNIKKHNKKKF